MAELHSDEIMAKDLNAPATFANICRVRAENQFIVLDLGYLPPLDSTEVEYLRKEPIKVSQRVILTEDVARTLAQLIDQVTDASDDEAFTPNLPGK